MIKKTILACGLFGCLMLSATSHAITSRCSVGYDYDNFYHLASLDFWELYYPLTRTWIETYVDGPVSPSLFSLFYNTLNSWHWFVDMPPGEYEWYGASQSEVSTDVFWWEFLDFGACFGRWTVPEPAFCESTEVQVTGTTMLTSDVHGYIVEGLTGGLNAVENLGLCSSTGTPTFSGSLELQNVSQCCEESDSNESSTRATGNAVFHVPGVTCRLKQIIVPAYGIVIEGSIGAFAEAAFGYSGMSQGMCGEQSAPMTLSGTVLGGVWRRGRRRRHQHAYYRGRRAHRRHVLTQCQWLGYLLPRD